MCQQISYLLSSKNSNDISHLQASVAVCCTNDGPRVVCRSRENRPTLSHYNQSLAGWKWGLERDLNARNFTRRSPQGRPPERPAEEPDHERHRLFCPVSMVEVLGLGAAKTSLPATSVMTPTTLRRRALDHPARRRVDCRAGAPRSRSSRSRVKHRAEDIDLTRASQATCGGCSKQWGCSAAVATSVPTCRSILLVRIASNDRRRHRPRTD